MICIDSDCIIDFLNGNKEAKNVIERYKEDIATTEINVFEVFFGIYNKKFNKNEEEIALSFFETIKILCNNNWGRNAAKILSDLAKKGKMIGQNDCLISAIMLKNNCNIIITNNKQHFSRIDDVKVISY